MPHTPAAESDFAAILELPFGKFGICVDAESVTELRFLPPQAAARPATTEFAAEIAARIRTWIAAPRTPLQLPLAACGSAFQRRVRAALQTIPPGEVRTYGEIAHLLGSAPRAVGQACGANPFPLVVPCHRVVAANGIGGFANARDGYLIDAKRWLLRNEA